MNRLSWIGAVGACLLATMPLAAQDQDADSAISTEQQQAIALAIERGETIYRHDQTAWHTTDAMLEAIDDPAAQGVAGWIVNPVEGGHEAVFYRPVEDGFEAVWSGVYDGSEVRDQRTYAGGERALTEEEAAMVQAFSAPFSVDTDYSLCSEQLNQVVFPTGKPDGGLFVYLLMPQPAMDQIPFGGHFRFEVVDGKVVDHRKFANSCLTMPTSGPNGEASGGLYVSHILDDTPTEIHVFSMLAAGLPVSVITSANEKVWQVSADGGSPSITQVDP